LIDVAKDQLAFAAGIARVDDALEALPIAQHRRDGPQLPACMLGRA
jgi:hypothetical protein